MQLKIFKTLSYNIFFRTKKLLLLTTFLIIILVFSSSFRSINAEPRSIEIEEINFAKRKLTYANPIYPKWEENFKDSIEEKSLNEKCLLYFEELSKIYPGNPGPDIIDMEEIQNFSFNRLIYKKRKWIRERIRELKRQLSREGSRFTEDHERQIELEYVKSAKEVLSHENKIVQEFNHMRVLGKCFIENSGLASKEDEKICENNERKLYPWMSKNWPDYENWKGEKLDPNEVPVYDKNKYLNSVSSSCFIKELKNKSNGKGIVITILPTLHRNRQIENVKRLIKVLRGLKNQLPIEIAYLDNGLNDQEKKQLINEARTEISDLPSSFEKYYKLANGEDANYRFLATRDYPKQDLWFVDLTPVKNKKQHPLVAKTYIYNSPSFILILSMIFNSFEETIMLSSQTIPLIDKLDEYLLNNTNYQTYGMLFFKNPSYYSSKPRRFNPGYHEVTDLIKNNMMPSTFDSIYFGINRRDKEISTATNRVFEDNFQSLLDPSLMVINKPKILNGLLISCNLQLYKLLSGRLEIADDTLNAEFLWIGQEIAGTSVKVNFNRNYGVSAGILTPSKNKPFDLLTLSEELCSSSWGQLSDEDDYSLIYVTTHQLENWIYDGFEFQTNLEKKFTIIESILNDINDQNSSITEVENKDLFESIKQYPLYIESVMNPPVINTPVFEQDFKEPSQAWFKVDNFGSSRSHPYWCSYNIVGTPNTSKRGIIITYNELMKAKFKFLLDLWLEDIYNKI